MEADDTAYNLAFGTSGGRPTNAYNPPPATRISSIVNTVAGATSGSGNNTTTATTDPYARWGGKSAYDSLISGFNTQKSNIYDTSREAAQARIGGRHNNILDFIDQLKTGQRNIDEQGIQNELAKKQGYTSILDMVGKGIRSGGNFLAQRNASDSSAAGGIAKAYGEYGQRELGNIGNQYEQGNRNIEFAQTDFDTQRNSGLRKFEQDKVETVNNIVLQARDRLAALDASAVETDLPTRINIEQEKEAIKRDVLGILSRFDQELAQGASRVKALGSDERRSQALGLYQEGRGAANPFDFQTEVPTQLQGTGPLAGGLPLFTTRRNREE